MGLVLLAVLPCLWLVGARQASRSVLGLDEARRSARPLRMLNVQDIVLGLLHCGSAGPLLVRPFLQGISLLGRPPRVA